MSVVETLDSSFKTADELEVTGGYSLSAAELKAHAMQEAHAQYLQGRPTPPKLAPPSRDYIQRFKAGQTAVRVDWNKLAAFRTKAEACSLESLPRTPGDDAEGEGEDEEVSETGSPGSRSPLTEQSDCWLQPEAEPAISAKSRSADGSSSAASPVEVVHTLSDSSRITMVFTQPRMPEGVVRLFNKDAKGTVLQLLSGESDLASRAYTSDDIARWLLTASGLSKNKLGDYLGRSDDQAVATLDAFVGALKPYFPDFTFDEAMRFFLSLFRLPGEAQQIARILEKFAAAYAAAHPRTFRSADTAYVLAYSLIMLNVDAHNDQVVHKMTVAQFISNNRGIDDGEDLPRELLEHLYASIVNREIRIEQREYISAVNEGWLFKQGGRVKTWKKRYIILSGSVLYYYKSPKDREPLGFVPLENIDVAVLPEKLTFRLTPSSSARMKSVRIGKGGKGSVFEKGHHKSFLFRTSSTDAMKHWVDSIRTHAVETGRVGSAPPSTASQAATSRRSLG